MNFQIKFYRAPASNHLIVIGRGQIDMEGVEQLIPPADDLLYQTLEKYFEQLTDHGLLGGMLLAAVRKTITESIREGKPNLTDVARKLEIGPRTLQRRLKKYGIDFKELVDSARRRLALAYLKDGGITLTEIAFLLGYSEVSAFNRAFKRWTNSTPLDYRGMSARARGKIA
jgi:AraC-like DNA-binding protein